MKQNGLLVRLTHMEAIDCLVIESGAEWAPGLERVGSSFVALAQEPDESPDAFSARVRTRLESIFRDGSRMRRLVICADEAWRVGTLQARFEILQKLRAEQETHGNAVEVLLVEGTRAQTVSVRRASSDAA